MSVEGDQVDKLKLNDSLESILIKMSVGNPGAAQTIIELFTSHEQIDRDFQYVQEQVTQLAGQLIAENCSNQAIK
jgi:hypothetical protein